MSQLCCVSGEIFSLSWFSKEVNWLIEKQLTSWHHPYTYWELIFVRWGFLFSIESVPRYKLYLCQTPIIPDLLDFPGIWCLCVTTWSRGWHHIALKKDKLKYLKELDQLFWVWITNDNQWVTLTLVFIWNLNSYS